MDVEEYLAARHGRLLDAAIGLGVAEEEAPGVVERAVRANARLIRRSGDPHAEILRRLPEYVDGEPRAVPRWPLVTAAVVFGVLLTTASTVGDRAPLPPGELADDQVPSLFGYDAPAARALLTGRGYTVRTRPVERCETPDRVVSSEPATGTYAAAGAEITLGVAVPGEGCGAGLAGRALAWSLIDFANERGPAPRFNGTVGLIVDRSEPATLTRAQAEQRSTWSGTSALTALASASRQVDQQGRDYRTPTLDVVVGPAPGNTCGIPRPRQAGAREAVTVTIRLRGSAPGLCPASVSIYRSSYGIDSIVLYTRKQDDGPDGRPYDTTR